MLEVGDNEPDSVTKTGADGDVPAPREAARRISRGSQRAWTAVGPGPHRPGLKRRHNNGRGGTTAAEGAARKRLDVIQVTVSVSFTAPLVTT